jgi:hypothetical protein
MSSNDSEALMGTKTMVFKECGGVLLCVHGAEDPRPEEWVAYVDYCLKLPRSCNKALVVTDGGGPNAAQRKVLQDRYLAKHDDYRVAVLTDSAVVRGIVKALNWFNPLTQPFTYDEGRGIAQAMAHLGDDGGKGTRIRFELEMLRRDLVADALADGATHGPGGGANGKGMR